MKNMGRVLKRIKKIKAKKTTDKIYNFGLGFLKMILALDVIISHCYNRNYNKSNKFLSLYVIKRRIHVPSFVIMSFNFT